MLETGLCALAMGERNVYSRLVSYVGGLQSLVSRVFDNRTTLLDSV